MHTYVIPDLHGMKNLLDKALFEINERECATPNRHKIVFLGDYIDRGPESAQVVKTIRDGIEAGKPWIALKGNHEDFMAQAVVDNNENMGGNWFINGGRETIDSYLDLKTLTGIGYMEADALWMKSLPTYYQDEHRVYVHAFAPEQFNLEDAPEHTLLWTRYPKGDDIGYRGKHVVHGHTPQKEPELLINRTNLDCGAVFGNTLAIGVFKDDLAWGPVEVHFVR